MAFTEFFFIVCGLAVAYALILWKIQEKFVDRKLAQDLQKESKELTAEFDKAKKAGDKKKMDEVLARQMESLQKMKQMTVGQLKFMVVVITVFLTFTWFINYLDPTQKDDIILHLLDNGQGCDKIAGDHIFSGCYQLDQNATTGKWVVRYKTMEGQNELSKNSTFFLVETNDLSDTFVDIPPENQQTLIGLTDKTEYSRGEQIKITVQSEKASSATATLDMRTSFYVDLPITIPVINLRRVHYADKWFILAAMLANIAISLVMNKKRAEEAKKKEVEQKA